MSLFQATLDITNLYRMIKESGLKIYAFDGLDEAAAKAVEMAK